MATEHGLAPVEAGAQVREADLASTLVI